LGFVTMTLERSGRDASGTGGGAPGFGIEGLGALSLGLFAVLESSCLFIPYERADLTGLGGDSSTETLRVCAVGSGLVGLLGGSAGVVAGGVISTVATLGDDFVDVSDILLFSASLYPGNAFDFSISLYLFSIASFVRLGGNGGKVAGSKTGAFTLPASIEGVLDPGVVAAPFERVEMVEMVDEIDSFEAFLPSCCCCSEGLRGGRAGEGCVDCLLVGNLGGGTGVGFRGWSTFWPVRTMFVGGGSTPFLFGRLGSLPMPLFESPLCPYV